MRKSMKFFVVGCGSIGERHIKNLINLSSGEIFAYDINTERLDLMKEKYHINIYEDIKDGFDQGPNAVLICNPPNLHIQTALKAIDCGAHVFIEKPLSHNLENVNDFLMEAKRKKLVILVGYMLRYHPGIQLMKKMIDDGAIGKILSINVDAGQYLPDWRPWQDYRQSYSSKVKLGGGIILDGSHEIDYVYWFIGKIREVVCFADKISNLEVDVEDTAELLFRFENNVIGEIHLDFLQREYSRNCKIIGEEGTIIWDYPRNFVKIFSANTKRWKTITVKIEPNDMYIQEIRHFLNCINGKAKPLVDGFSALEVLKIALAAKKSAKTGKVIKL